MGDVDTLVQQLMDQALDCHAQTATIAFRLRDFVTGQPPLTQRERELAELAVNGLMAARGVNVALMDAFNVLNDELAGLRLRIGADIPERNHQSGSLYGDNCCPHGGLPSECPDMPRGSTP